MAAQTNQEKLARAEQIAEGLRKMFGRGPIIDVTPVYHRNEQLTGICIRLAKQGVGTTMYLEDIPQDLSLEEQTWRAAAMLQDGLKELMARPKLDLPSMERDQILQDVVIQALSQERNRELLEKNAHVKVLDLAAVFRIPVASHMPGQYLSALIPRQVADYQHLTDEELYEAAKRNTVEKYGVMITKMDPRRILEQDWKKVPLADIRLNGKCGYILTTNEVNGAALMLIPAVLKEVRRKMGEDFYIVPSSIHEVILWKKSLHYQVESMKRTVYEMNRKPNMVEPKDVLSDSVYFYDGRRDKLLLV